MVRRIQNRIVAIGDLHGDFACLLACLRIAHCILPSGKWNPKIKDTTVVVCGDMIDRYRVGHTKLSGEKGEEKTPGEFKFEEEYIVVYLNYLADQCAKLKTGCRVQKLVGNHELMRLSGNAEYASPYARRNGCVERWMRGTPMAEELMRHGTKAVTALDGWCFSHASVLPTVVKETRQCKKKGGAGWVCQRQFEATINQQLREFATTRRNLKEIPALHSDDGILWDRTYSGDDAHTCGQVSRALELLSTGESEENQAEHFVIAHCPQHCRSAGILSKSEALANSDPNRVIYTKDCSSPAISSACDKKVYRIDVAMSRAWNEDVRCLPHVLEIVRGSGEKQWTRVIAATPAFYQEIQNPGLFGSIANAKNLVRARVNKLV